VAQDAAELYNTYLYNVDDLSGIVEQNKRARAGEIPRVEAIIDEHVAKFEAWQAGVELSVVLRELREKLARDRDAFLHKRLDGAPDLSAAERERLVRVADELIEQLVLAPVDRLRNHRDLRCKLADLEAVRNLFGLDREKT
jgi:glutamyl-tRNA reductase